MTAALMQAGAEFDTVAWLNTHRPVTLAALRGKVVAVHAFQMLCPGCVAHGLPQAQAIRRSFPAGEVEVLGLHTVFEHHDVMTERALQAFLHEYRVDFPVGIDRPAASGAVPRTMALYGMRGTPTLLLFDRQGRLRHHLFGRTDDLQVGALIGQLVAEEGVRCDDDGCRIGVGSPLPVR
ncbi:peroxiredoxin [Pseudoduganella lurida]|uniref:Peroxiredoxin n=1 Tax=Pseudoduganella lurida TaxID=1036180 RepID=A0A562RMY2_9BURK|nr:TlpA disulfide reductase family protein [Pseudoduganella lurida]TWI69780.1 peroxiredoxin [Pseudoduganella lurida]